MPKHLLATVAMLAAMLLAGGGQAVAQDQPELQNEPAPAPAGATEPDPETAESTTGGVTAHGRENLPDDGTEEPVDGQALDSAASGSPEATTQPGAGRTDVVGEAMVKELHQMGLAQQKAAAKPTPPKTEEQKAAEQKAIAAHREAVFSRVEERS